MRQHRPYWFHLAIGLGIPLALLGLFVLVIVASRLPEPTVAPQDDPYSECKAVRAWLASNYGKSVEVLSWENRGSHPSGNVTITAKFKQPGYRPARGVFTVKPSGLVEADVFD